MKLSKYIVPFIGSMIAFIATWIVYALIKPETGKELGFLDYVGAILMTVVMIITMVSLSIKLLWSSIRTLLSFRKQQHIWKILTLGFGIGLTLFAGLVVIFNLVWIIFAITKGFANGFPFSSGENEGPTWFTGIYVWFVDAVGKAGNGAYAGAAFGLFVTSFVFTLIWSAAGITFEILKKVLGGNMERKNKNSNNDFNNNQNYNTNQNNFNNTNQNNFNNTNQNNFDNNSNNSNQN